jgi:hypothetical protein
VSRERTNRALEMREAGSTYKQIGTHLGVSACRARDIVKAGLRSSLPRWSDGLSSKTANLLSCAGYSSKEQVLSDVVGEILCVDAPTKPSGYGQSSHKEVCEWLGIQISENEWRKPIAYKSIERAISLLTRNGYRIERPE